MLVEMETRQKASTHCREQKTGEEEESLHIYIYTDAHMSMSVLSEASRILRCQSF